MQEDVPYKNYTIRVYLHQDRCSDYSYVIIDPDGNEIKHVTGGGNTKDKAIANAEEMIDMELKIQQEQSGSCGPY